MNGSGPGVSGATHLSVSQGRGHNKAGLDCRSASRMARSQDRQRGVGCWGGGASVPLHRGPSQSRRGLSTA